MHVYIYIKKKKLLTKLLMKSYHTTQLFGHSVNKPNQLVSQPAVYLNSHKFLVRIKPVSKWFILHVQNIERVDSTKN